MVESKLNLTEDKELFEALEKAGLAAAFPNSEVGKLFAEAKNRIVEKTLYSLCYKTDLSDLALVTRLVERIKLNKFELFNDLKMLANQGEMIFEELEVRGQIRAPGTETGSGQEP